MIGRRFVLLACGAFVTDVMLRMVFLSAACLLITLYHVLKNPCRHPIANDAETFFLVTLSLVVIINLTKATTLSFGITTDGPSGAYLKGLERFEVCALAFVHIDHIRHFLSVCEICSSSIEKCLRCCIFFYPWYEDQKQRPLLPTAEQNFN